MKNMVFTPNILSVTKACSKSSGFTLLEVMLVSVIILMLVTLSMPIFRRTYDDLKISSCAKDIAQMMSFARERAVFERINYRFVINDTNNIYQLLAQCEEYGEFKTLTDKWGRINRVPEDIDIQTEVKSIDFSPAGISDSAAIYITNRKNRTYSITLDGGSGSVKVDDKKE